MDKKSVKSFTLVPQFYMLVEPKLTLQCKNHLEL